MAEVRILRATGSLSMEMTRHTFSRHAHLTLPRIRQLKEVVANIQTSEAEIRNDQARSGIFTTIKLHEGASCLPCSPFLRIETSGIAYAVTA